MRIDEDRFIWSNKQQSAMLQQFFYLVHSMKYSKRKFNENDKFNASIYIYNVQIVHRRIDLSAGEVLEARIEWCDNKIQITSM